MKKYGVFLCLLFFIAFVRTEDASVVNESLNVTTENSQEHPPTNSTTEHNSNKDYLEDSSNEDVNKIPDHPSTDNETNSSDYYNDEAMNPEGGYEEINSTYTAHQEEGIFIHNKEQTSTFALEWEEKMKDYEPDYVYMIPIGYKKKEIYYENITHVPVTIRGAFLTDEDKKDKIEFAV